MLVFWGVSLLSSAARVGYGAVFCRHRQAIVGTSASCPSTAAYGARSNFVSRARARVDCRAQTATQDLFVVLATRVDRDWRRVLRTFVSRGSDTGVRRQGLASSEI